jgi:hypothetical protein
MSNEAHNQQTHSWISRDIAVAVISVLGVIGAAVISNLDKLPSLKSNHSPVFGKIEVDAKMPGGTPFTNPYNLSKKYRFVASGEWTYNTEIPEIGMHDPRGYQALIAPDHYYLPGAKEGALIVLRENNSYELIGNEAILELQPKETVFFMINDTNKSDGANYSDNDGAVTVEWQLRKL